jgi:hypothetical protein
VEWQLEGIIRTTEDKEISVGVDLGPNAPHLDGIGVSPIADRVDSKIATRLAPLETKLDLLLEHPNQHSRSKEGELGC